MSDIRFVIQHLKIKGNSTRAAIPLAADDLPAAVTMGHKVAVEPEAHHRRLRIVSDVGDGPLQKLSLVLFSRRTIIRPLDESLLRNRG